jgi:hypothetical protein
MKTRNFQTLALTVTTVAAAALLTGNAAAQESSTSTTAAPATTAAQPAATSPPAPQLSYGVAEVVQLARANVSEDIIVNYVQNSGNGYGLDANQILYLKQQGVSDRIINTMLDQRSRVAATAQAAPQNNAGAGSTQTAAVVPQPMVSYVQTVPYSTVYVIPDTQTYNYYAYYYHPYYYPYYGWYGWPAVSLSFGYYGGYRGGYWGGWHGGGGWHR